MAITYRLTEHFHYWTKHIASSSELQTHFFVELPDELAREKNIKSGDRVRVSSARGKWKGRRWSPSECAAGVQGRESIMSACRSTGFLGKVSGPFNNLTASVFDPNSGTPEYKGFLVNLEKLS